MTIAHDEVWRLGATELLAAYAARTLSPVDVIEATFARIAALDGALNAFVALSSTAREEAAASALRWTAGTPIGPLDGVPVAVKDNIAVAGMPATFGSALYAGHPCAADELPVARLRAAGAIIVGKTNTPEFACEGYTGNALFGDTKNPFDLDLTPGGSSGGSVAAVAAGLVPLALGTDGGGSTRRPAAYTSLVGLKPGIGTIARAGGLPQILMDFEVIGTFARSAADNRLLFEALAGPDRTDPASRPRVAPHPGTGFGAGDRPLTVRLVERLDDAPCDPAILAAVRRAGDVLSGMGHRVVPGDLPVDTAHLATHWSAIAEIGLARLMETEPDFRAKAMPKYIGMAERGAGRSAADLLAIIEAVALVKRQTSAVFADCDLVLMPACAAMPWPFAEVFPPEIDGTAVGPRGHAVYTGWVNAAGHPAMSLPCPLDEGLPIGAQFIADLGGESLLLDLANAYAAEVNLFPRWPAMASALS
ncbi:amidase [Acuticoccus yangtzensis]|uniref:amidase n=1 Tax=Acuticoccus yangtzensis TaxID=1443441 RepID=UPI00094996B1|nr:amidase [Acuticoccus yangtzensis]